MADITEEQLSDEYDDIVRLAEDAEEALAADPENALLVNRARNARQAVNQTRQFWRELGTFAGDRDEPIKIREIS